MYVCASVGAMMSFISAPVISGFTSAAAITIAMGQVKVSCSTDVIQF